jgi:hypothetical protein
MMNRRTLIGAAAAVAAFRTVKAASHANRSRNDAEKLERTLSLSAPKLVGGYFIDS